MDYRVLSLERAMNWGHVDGGVGMGLVVKEDVICLALLRIIGVISTTRMYLFLRQLNIIYFTQTRQIATKMII